MIGKVESLDYDGDAVRRVRLTFPQRERDGTSDSSTTMDIHMCECIGKGSFGTVYRAVSADYPQLAVKISTGKTTRLRQELDVLRKVCTKGALPLPRFEFGALNQTSDLIVIGMELCMPCTLHDLLLSTRLTSTRDMLFIAHQAAQAVGCVHAEGCIHRDVKLQNYVFDSQGNLKLIDFGLSCNTLKPPAGDVVAGTVSFMSPEMAHNALHKEQRVSVGASADVWSLGIVLFSIFTQRNPYPTTPVAEANEDSRGEQGASTGHGTSVDTTGESTAIPQKRINEALLRRVSRGEWQWPVGCTVPSELKQLVEAVLVVNPEQRPTVEAILAMRVWNNRARAPPSAVTAFLGVQDDFFFSNDEETLLKAVEQRSEGVKASRTQSRAGSRDVSASRRALRAANEEDEDEDVHDPQKRDSLKFVAKESATMGGAPSVQVYDVRASTKKRSKPIREISQVIAEETAKAATKAGGRRARSAKSKSAVAPTSAATAPSSRMPSQRSSAPASRAGSRGRVHDARADEVTDAATPKHSSPSNAYEVNSTPSNTGNSSGDISAANDGQRQAVTSHVEDKDVCTRLEDQFEMGTREESRKPRGGRLSRSEPALPTGSSLHIVSKTAVDDDEDTDERSKSDLEDEEGSTTKAAPRTHGNNGSSRSRPRDTTLRERSSSILNGVSHPGSRETSVNMNRLPPHLSSRQGSRQAAPALPLPPAPPAPPATAPMDPFLADSNSNTTSSKRSHKAKKATAKKRPRSIPRNASSTDDLVKPLTPSKKLALELTMEVFMRQEHDCRALLARRLMLEQQWLLTAFRVMTEENQERAHIVWNGTEQLANLEHPHTFKELLEIPNKTYANGFTCDACLYDFFPDGRTKKSMHFFHCTCGQDLCPDCYRDYTRRCTCACCGVVHRNPKALREHTKSGVAACRPRAAAGIVSAASAGVTMDEPLSFGAPPSLGSTSRLAANRANFSGSKKGGSGKTVSPAQHLKRSGKSSAKSSLAATAHMGIAQGTLRERLDAASETASYSDSAPFQAEHDEEADFSDGSESDDDRPRGRHGARVAPRSRGARQRLPPVSEHFEKEIAELPKGPWKPFAKLRSDRNEIDPSRMPTAQERQDILNGDWLRYFYFYPPVETEETFAFVYHAQPGRTGAVFLNSEFTAHSAVFSMLEHQFFVVENIQMECRAEEDVTVAMPLAMAKSNPRVKGTYQALEAIVAHDTNMTKQQRPPGNMSVYFPPTNMFTSKGAPVLYVRWFRCSADRTITAILLSNGALQVFVNNEFELRWLDPERKFLIGKNGTCELIDDETFELAPLINDVLYSSYDV